MTRVIHKTAAQIEYAKKMEQKILKALGMEPKQEPVSQQTKLFEAKVEPSLDKSYEREIERLKEKLLKSNELNDRLFKKDSDHTNCKLNLETAQQNAARIREQRDKANWFVIILALLHAFVLVTVFMQFALRYLL